MPELRVLMLVIGQGFIAVGGVLMALSFIWGHPQLWRWGITMFSMGMYARMLVEHDG